MLNVVVYVNYKFGGFGEFWFVFNVMVFMIDIDVIIRWFFFFWFVDFGVYKKVFYG